MEDAREILNKRILESNKALLDIYANLDPTDPKYWEHLKIAQAFHKGVIEDQQADMGDQRKKEELDIEADKNEIELRKVEEAERSNRKGERLEVSKQAVMVGTTLFSTLAGVWMFKRSTKKEADEAILTTTDQTVVKNGLGSIFKFGNKNNLL